ncbi:MAG: extracellular solute-binding protein [Hungatella sp.]|nr:extracellular solute-binding protein [Hungatella sp.]
MKKPIALLLAAAMTAGLSACGGSSEPAGTQAPASSAAGGETKEAQAPAAGGETQASQTPGEGAELVVAWWGNQVRNERTQAALDLYSEQNPGVTFDGQFSEWADYWNKLATAAAGHSMPDIIQQDYKYIQQYVSNDLLVDLTPYIEDGTIDVSNCNEDILNSGKIGDGIYAICNGINTPALLYNKTALDAAGITVKDNMTLDEFVALSKEIQEKTGYKTNLAYGNNEILAEYLLRADDIVMFEEDKLGGTAEDYVAYMKLYEDGIKEGWVIDAAVFAETTIGSVEQNPLVYGTSPETMSWCMCAYTNQLTAFRNAAPEGVEIGMTTWPSKDPAKSDYLKPSQFFSITKDSANPDEAAKVLNFITNSVDCNNILLGERGIPLSSAVAEAIAPNMDETSQEVIKFINEVVSPNSSQINPPAPDSASEVNNLINKLEEQVCYGQMSAEEAGKQLFEEGNAIMGSK